MLSSILSLFSGGASTVMSLSAKLLIVVAVAIGAFFYGQHVSNTSWDAKLATEQAQAAKQEEAAAVKLRDAQTQLDDTLAQQTQQNATVQKRVTVIEQHPIYKNQCLDQDGINAANDALSDHAVSNSLH